MTHSFLLRSLLAAALISAPLCCVPEAQPPSTAKKASSEAPRAAAPVRKETAPAAAIDRASCGLPPGLRKPDWPVRLGPTQPEDPSPPQAEDVTLVVLPDTQYYASCRETHMKSQTQYVARLAQERRVAATLFLGDLTEHNSADEWRYVQDALDQLPGHLPFVLATGNHDYGRAGTADVRTTRFNELLKPPNQTTQNAVLGQMEPGHWENVLYRLRVAEYDVAVLVLEWSPRSKAVSWAQEMLRNFPDERLIFITHAYMYFDDTRYDWQGRGAEQEWNPVAYGTAKMDPTGPAGGENLHPDGAWDGQMLWDGLLRDYPGLFLTLSGHVLGDGAGRLLSRGSAGNVVHQVLTNYQMLDEGGLGYLRLLEFAADGTSLVMKTFSPSLHVYATAKDQFFTLNIEPQLKNKWSSAASSSPRH